MEAKVKEERKVTVDCPRLSCDPTELVSPFGSRSFAIWSLGNDRGPSCDRVIHEGMRRDSFLAMNLGTFRCVSFFHMLGAGL